MANAARARARRLGLACTISFRDIVIPSHCPILGIPLYRRTGKQGGCNNSPSLDKIVPALGYTPDNIVVISARANRLKNDASVEELTALADFYTFGIHGLRPRAGKKTRVRKDPA